MVGKPSANSSAKIKFFYNFIKMKNESPDDTIGAYDCDLSNRNASQRRMLPEVIWLEYENGWSAETEHGFFFVYGILNLWYIDYETGAGPMGMVLECRSPNMDSKTKMLQKSRGKVREKSERDSVFRLFGRRITREKSYSQFSKRHSRTLKS